MEMSRPYDPRLLLERLASIDSSNIGMTHRARGIRDPQDSRIHVVYDQVIEECYFCVWHKVRCYVFSRNV